MASVHAGAVSDAGPRGLQADETAAIFPRCAEHTLRNAVPALMERGRHLRRRSAAVWLRGVRCRAGPALLVLAMLHSSCPHGMGAETTLRVSASECGWVGTRQWRSLAKYRLDLRGGAPDTDGSIAAIEAELARTQKNKATMGHLCALRARLAALKRAAAAEAPGGSAADASRAARARKRDAVAAGEHLAGGAGASQVSHRPMKTDT